MEAQSSPCPCIRRHVGLIRLLPLLATRRSFGDLLSNVTFASPPTQSVKRRLFNGLARHVHSRIRLGDEPMGM